jgi:hypothetical protein
MKTQTPWMDKVAAMGTMTALALLSLYVTLSALGTILLKLQF